MMVKTKQLQVHQVLHVILLATRAIKEYPKTDIVTNMMLHMD